MYYILYIFKKLYKRKMFQTKQNEQEVKKNVNQIQALKWFTDNHYVTH